MWSEKSQKVCVAAYCSLLAVVTISVCSWLIAFENDWERGDYFKDDHKGNLIKFGRDWKALPYADVIVVEATI